MLRNESASTNRMAPPGNQHRHLYRAYVTGKCASAVGVQGFDADAILRSAALAGAAVRGLVTISRLVASVAMLGEHGLSLSWYLRCVGGLIVGFKIPSEHGDRSDWRQW